MNSQIPDHRTPMLNPQYYDDSKLQRRTKFLISGLLLCFVIGVASLGISIMILLKNQDLPDLVDYVKKAPQSQKIKTDVEEANNRISALQKEIENLRARLDEEFQRHSDVEDIIIPLDMSSDHSHKVHNNNHGGHHDHHGLMPESNMDSDLLDKNFDLFFTNEGSGNGDDSSYESEDYYEGIGSGDSLKCVVFPTPYCPDGHKICWTDDKCPVPFCCTSFK